MLVRVRYGEKVTKNMFHIRFVVKIKSKSQSCSSRGEEALIPVLGTIDSVKYIDIF